MSPLLNYTTKVPAVRTAGAISELLVAAGARSVATEYDEDGTPTSIGFAMQTPAGVRAFSLPVNAAAVHKVLLRDRVEARYSTADQAERVAWRILKDWVEAQLAIVKTEMVSLDQVMLPYMRGDDGRTVYELYLDRQLALPAGEAIS